MGKERVTVERIRHDATLIIIRLGLGGYELKGPLANVLEPESYVACSTVLNELAGEGYALVSPESYAEHCAVTGEEVAAMVWEEGSLFALACRSAGEPWLVVPLPEKESLLPEIH